MKAGKKAVLFILLAVAGGLILAGTALQWSNEKRLTENDEERDNYRYSQLIFWFSFAAALMGLLTPNPLWNAIQGGLLFALVARRIGDGAVSFEQIDRCRILSEENDHEPVYAKCAGGGVLEYFGVLLAWFVSLPEIHMAHMKTSTGVSMIVSTVLAFIGIIVLFTSNAVKFNTPRSCDGQPSCPNVRAAVFDSAMYTIWALIFGFSGFLCDVASVLTAMIFYLTWLATVLFSTMFTVQAVLQQKEDAVWSGFIMCWMGVLGMLLSVSWRVFGANITESFLHDSYSGSAPRKPKTKTTLEAAEEPAIDPAMEPESNA